MATTIIRLGLTDHGRAMTLDEFRDAEELDGYRYELGRGLVEASDVPDDDHGMIVWRLYQALGQDRHTCPRILWYGGGASFRLWLPKLGSVRSPDVSVVLKGTPLDPHGRRPPSLVAEVIAAESEVRDYVTKREEYLAYGLREYWIVDPRARKVTVLVRDGDAWAERVCVGEQPIPSLVLPDLATTAETLFAKPEGDGPTR